MGWPCYLPCRNILPLHRMPCGKTRCFSCGIMLMTLQLYDLLFLSRSPISNRWVLLLSVATFFVAFWRNNGIYILVVIALVLLIVGVAKAANNGSSSADAIRNGRSRYFVPAVVLVAFSVAQVVITGPLYDSLGIGSDSKTESYGIPINQIARVVALDGEMSDADRAFFEALIPTARVREVYSPTCVDSIKYDAQFNYELLGHEDFLASLAFFIPTQSTGCISKHGNCRLVDFGQ